ncbi:MAG TPA: beta-propeller fold lactonase family protein [Casimicrobiaceae bacterium]|nr:beta-propeller fold lactonase family protein [Casimicrobiaceae bacterium]
MKALAPMIRGIAVAAIASLVGSAPALAATFVYVSNAEDGDIGVYRMLDSGELQPGARAKAASIVMPMVVSPDRRFLYAASRSKPYLVHAYTIDRNTGALTPLATSPLAESFPYISLDKTGRFLFGASYGGHVISVNAVGSDGRVAAEPLQVIPVGRNAHSIRVDESNKFVYVPTLGSDAIFQFTFDEKTGKLSSNTPAVYMMKAMTGPRHFITSSDNKYLYALNELLGTVTTFSVDGKTGLLTEVSSASGLPPDTKLVPGAPRGAVGAPGEPPPRNIDNDIWAADIHMTPNGKFMYISERTGHVLAAFSVDGTSGKLTYLSSTPTERQPRGFTIDPKGRFLVATGEKSETISVYSIDQASGGLKLLNKYPTGKGANWVEIVSFD